MKGTNRSQIRATRLRKGVGVRELARLSGVTPAAVIKWERSEAEGTAQIRTVAKALNALGETLVTSSRPSRGSAEKPMERREDRTSLELHRAVAKKMISDPEAVFEKVPENIEVLRTQVRGSLAHEWLDEWQSLVESRSLGGLVDVMLGTDPRSVDLRQVSPFAKVLSQDERIAAIRKAQFA